MDTLEDALAVIGRVATTTIIIIIIIIIIIATL